MCVTINFEKIKPYYYYYYTHKLLLDTLQAHLTKVNNFKKFLLFKYRKIHGQSTANVAQARCDHCNEEKPTLEVDLSYHLNTKHKDKIPTGWLHCFDCSWSYSSKENFDIHRIFCKTNIHSTEDILSAKIGIQCQFCPTVFGKATFNMYYKHARKYHQKQVESDWRTCKNCLLAYPTEYTLKTHQR